MRLQKNASSKQGPSFKQNRSSQKDPINLGPQPSNKSEKRGSFQQDPKDEVKPQNVDKEEQEILENVQQDEKVDPKNVSYKRITDLY